MNENVHKMKNEKLPSQWPPDFSKKLHEDHILAQKGHRADLFLPFFFLGYLSLREWEEMFQSPLACKQGGYDHLFRCLQIFANDSEGPYEFSWHEM